MNQTGTQKLRLAHLVDQAKRALKAIVDERLNLSAESAEALLTARHAVGGLSICLDRQPEGGGGVMTTLKRPLVRAVKCRPEQTRHGVKPHLVVTIQPDGLLAIRPYRTRTAPTVSIPLPKLYARHLGSLCL